MRNLKRINTATMVYTICLFIFFSFYKSNKVLWKSPVSLKHFHSVGWIRFLSVFFSWYETSLIKFQLCFIWHFHTILVFVIHLKINALAERGARRTRFANANDFIATIFLLLSYCSRVILLVCCCWCCWFPSLF